MTKKKIPALITGFDGFAGAYLAEYLIRHNRKITGTVYNKLKVPPIFKSILSKKTLKSVTILPMNLVHYKSVKDVISKAKPREVYHLAGISHVPQSWANPRLAFSTNVMGTVHVLEAVREVMKAARVLVVSSAEVYGIPDPKNLPTQENAPLKPNNPYAATKAALDLLAYQWSQYPDMFIIRARPFSHTGPGQISNFVCSFFAREVAAISLGLCPPVIKVGDISVKRDFSDVRDIVGGYRLALEKGKNGEVYNVCSGKSQLIKSILHTLISFSDKKIMVAIDPDKFRASEIPETRGSHTKLTEDTGWEPRIPFSETLKNLYDFWLKRLKKQCKK